MQETRPDPGLSLLACLCVFKRVDWTVNQFLSDVNLVAIGILRLL